MNLNIFFQSKIKIVKLGIQKLYYKLAMSRSIIIIAILFVLAVAVRAIPESKLDYSDPHLIDKIVNGTIVVDIPAEHRNKRQSTIATLAINSGLGSPNIYFSTSSMGATTIPTGSPYGVSSVQLYDQNYILVLYGAQNYAGSYLVFRTLQLINDLSDYSFNDQTASAQIIYMGACTHSATLFENANLGGRSAYVTLGNYPDISKAGWSGNSYNQVRNDKLSSFEGYANTNVQLFSDGTYGGTSYGGPPFIPGAINTFTGTGFCNDCASSVKIVAV